MGRSNKKKEERFGRKVGHKIKSIGNSNWRTQTEIVNQNSQNKKMRGTDIPIHAESAFKDRSETISSRNRGLV